MPRRLRLGRRYVKYINDTYARTGTLWEGRYRASLIDSERYFLRCCRYIDLNPVRGGIVDEPGLYRWSSYRHYALGRADELVTHHDLYTRLGRSPEQQQSAYRALFGAGLDAAALSAIRDAAYRGWPLGSDSFKNAIERTLKRPTRPPKRGRPTASLSVR